MKNKLRYLVIIIVLCLSLSAAQAQQTPQKFIKETHYLLSLPDGYSEDTSRRWPLMIFLHGSGESGNDLEKIKVHGPPKLIELGKKFPFVVVSPQAQPNSGWEPENLHHLLDHIKQTQRVDDQKIYLTGLSMGGFGTWELAMKHPEEFAAIVPICGGGDTADAWKLRNISVWCFHGAKDDVVLPAASENMVVAAKRYNPSVKFTLYPDANHNSWERTYNNDSVYQWLLAQTKFLYKEGPVNTALLKQYEGRYVSPERDTVMIMAESNKLVAKTGNRTFPLKAAGNDLFFIQENRPLDIRFTRSKGAVSSFLFMGDRKTAYRKI